MSASPTSKYRSPTSEQDLVLAWIRRARESQLAHYAMADKLSKREHWLGVPVIAITAIVGTTVFASIAAEAISPIAKIAVGMFSVLATLLSSLQTFFKFSERAEKHRAAGARFSSVRRKLEVVYAQQSAENERNYIATLREELDRLAEESLNVPSKVFLEVQKNIYYPAGTTANEIPVGPANGNKEGAQAVP